VKPPYRYQICEHHRGTCEWCVQCQGQKPVEPEPCPTCAEQDAEIARLRELIMLPEDREAALVARATAAEQEHKAALDMWTQRERDFREELRKIEREMAATEQALAAAEQREAEKDRLFEAHTTAVGVFLSEMYGVMVDPLADGEVSVAEMQAALRKAALESRERAALMSPSTPSQSLTHTALAAYIKSTPSPAPSVPMDALSWQLEGLAQPSPPPRSAPREAGAQPAEEQP
jgi:hypothetical protein